MKTRIQILVFAAVMMLATSCGVYKAPSYHDPKPTIIGTELDGSYIIKAQGKGRNSAEAMIELQKRAVYEAVFNGVTSATSSVQSIPPIILAVNAKEKYAEWSNAFFADGGEYLKYCSKRDRRAGSSKFYRNNDQITCEGIVRVDVAGIKALLKEQGILQ